MFKELASFYVQTTGIILCSNNWHHFMFKQQASFYVQTTGNERCCTTTSRSTLFDVLSDHNP